MCVAVPVPVSLCRILIDDRLFADLSVLYTCRSCTSVVHVYIPRVVYHRLAFQTKSKPAPKRQIPLVMLCDDGT
jgi:hypothetical protein